jgi:Uma2 family endonuclease
MATAEHTSTLQFVTADGEIVVPLDKLQGTWTVQQYLRVTDSSNRLIEFTEREFEVLPMPTERHQAISQFLFLALLTFLHPHGGKVFYAPLRLQIREGKFREPDLLLVRDSTDPRRQDAYWLGQIW